MILYLQIFITIFFFFLHNGSRSKIYETKLAVKPVLRKNIFFFAFFVQFSRKSSVMDVQYMV